AKGDKGDTGATGATGATGPSAVAFISIPTFTLSTGTPNVSAISSSFGTLEASKSYKFELKVRGNSNQTGGVFALVVNTSGVGNTLNYDYTSAFITEFQSGSEVRSYHFNVVGTVVVGSLNSSLSIAITDGTATTQAFPMSIRGSGLITLVGSVTS
ncbi:MAG: hypothetical protein EBW79_06020, partial [Actinobacteria bacterium]|nr:hypothetical protein [Actinomycetota bacterium]